MNSHLSSVARLAASIGLLAACGGCSVMGYVNFEKDAASGTGKGSVHLYMPSAAAAPDVPKASALLREPAVTEAFPGLQPAISDSCKQPGTSEVAPAVLAAAPVLGKLLFDLYIDRQVRKLDELKEASEAQYSAKVILDAAQLQAAVAANQCILFVRMERESKVPGLVVVLKLRPSPNAFTFEPVFMAARNAVAVTQKGETPRIIASVAVGLKGIGKQQNGLPALASIGEASSTVPGLVLGAKEPACVRKSPCPVSDPIPLLAARNDLMLLTVAVAEKGDIGVDFDAAKAELNAIKAALGPLVGELVKGKLERNNE